jgi:DNA-binding transcriptional MerR regulator
LDRDITPRGARIAVPEHHSGDGKLSGGTLPNMAWYRKFFAIIVLVPLSDAATIVEDFADLVELAAADHSEPVRRYLAAVVRRHEQMGTGVRIAEAATLLSVETPTIRSWIERGALEEVQRGKVRHFSVVSVGMILAALRHASTTPSGQVRLERALEALRDRDRLADARELVEKLRADDLIEYDDADLAALRSY